MTPAHSLSQQDSTHVTAADPNGYFGARTSATSWTGPHEFLIRMPDRAVRYIPCSFEGRADSQKRQRDLVTSSGFVQAASLD